MRCVFCVQKIQPGEPYHLAISQPPAAAPARSNRAPAELADPIDEPYHLACFIATIAEATARLIDEQADDDDDDDDDDDGDAELEGLARAAGAAIARRMMRRRPGPR